MEEAAEAAHDALEQRVLACATALATADEDLKHFASMLAHDLRRCS